MSDGISRYKRIVGWVVFVAPGVGFMAFVGQALGLGWLGGIGALAVAIALIFLLYYWLAFIAWSFDV